jgi:hypothetical protein
MTRRTQHYPPELQAHECGIRFASLTRRKQGAPRAQQRQPHGGFMVADAEQCHRPGPQQCVPHSEPDRADSSVRQRVVGPGTA